MWESIHRHSIGMNCRTSRRWLIAAMNLVKTMPATNSRHRLSIPADFRHVIVLIPRQLPFRERCPDCMLEIERPDQSWKSWNWELSVAAVEVWTRKRTDPGGRHNENNFNKMRFSRQLISFQIYQSQIGQILDLRWFRWSLWWGQMG